MIVYEEEKKKKKSTLLRDLGACVLCPLQVKTLKTISNFLRKFLKSYGID